MPTHISCFYTSQSPYAGLLPASYILHQPLSLHNQLGTWSCRHTHCTSCACLSGQAEQPSIPFEYCDNIGLCNGTSRHGVGAAVRRSTRPRAAPNVYQPVWAVKEQTKLSSVEEEIEETQEGEDFHAVLPAVRQRPVTIPSDEQAWLKPPIWTGALQNPPPCPA